MILPALPALQTLLAVALLTAAWSVDAPVHAAPAPTPSALPWKSGGFFTSERALSHSLTFLQRNAERPATKVSSLRLSPSTVTAGQPCKITVCLDGVAPAEGVAVNLASDHPAVKLEPTVTVPAGAKEVTFTVEPSQVPRRTSGTVTVSWGDSVKRATLTVRTLVLKSLELERGPVVGTQESTGKVTLEDPAPPDGAAGVPASVTVPARQTSATFPITTTRVASNAEVSIAATYGEKRAQKTLRVQPVEVTLGFSPPEIVGSQPATGTVTLNIPAPPEGAVLTLANTNAAVQIPESVTRAPGAGRATFNLTTTRVVQATKRVLLVL